MSGKTCLIHWGHWVKKLKFIIYKIINSFISQLIPADLSLINIFPYGCSYGCNRPEFFNLNIHSSYNSYQFTVNLIYSFTCVDCAYSQIWPLNIMRVKLVTIFINFSYHGNENVMLRMMSGQIKQWKFHEFARLILSDIDVEFCMTF